MDGLDGKPSGQYATLQAKVEGLKSKLESIAKGIDKLTSRSRVDRFLQAKGDQERVDDFRKQIHDYMTSFLVATVLHITSRPLPPGLARFFSDHGISRDEHRLAEIVDFCV